MNKSTIIILVMITSLFWGLSFLATAVLCEYLAPIQIQTVRWTIASIVFAFVLLSGRIRIDFKKPYAKYLPIIGLLDPCIYMIFETYGISLTSSSVSSIFVATIPCMAMILNALFFRKRTNRMGVISILLAFGGVVICTVFSPMFSIHGDLTGYLMMICAVVVGGMFSIVSSKLSEQYTAIELTAVMSITGAIFYNILNIVIGYGSASYTAYVANPSLLIHILFLGVCCSAFCYLAFNKLLAMMDPALANNISTSTTTSVGVLAGIILGGDPGGYYTAIGLVITLSGVYLSSREL